MAYVGSLLDGEALGLRVEEVDEDRHEGHTASKEQEDAPLHTHFRLFDSSHVQVQCRRLNNVKSNLHCAGMCHAMLGDLLRYHHH